jgi:hypothetical protein
MGEAMFFPAKADSAGIVSLGPLRIQARPAIGQGAVKIAVRPATRDESNCAPRDGHARQRLGRLLATLYRSAKLANIMQQGLAPRTT